MGTNQTRHRLRKHVLFIPRSEDNWARDSDNHESRLQSGSFQNLDYRFEMEADGPNAKSGNQKSGNALRIRSDALPEIDSAVHQAHTIEHFVIVFFCYARLQITLPRPLNLHQSRQVFPNDHHPNKTTRNQSTNKGIVRMHLAHPSKDRRLWIYSMGCEWEGNGIGIRRQ